MKLKINGELLAIDHTKYGYSEHHGSNCSVCDFLNNSGTCYIENVMYIRDSGARCTVDDVHYIDASGYNEGLPFMQNEVIAMVKVARLHN
jgi:hypothetical protein